jgi:hypothetical protein
VQRFGAATPARPAPPREFFRPAVHTRNDALVRFIPRVVVVGVAVLATVGCGANEKMQVLSPDDLRRITTVRPVTPGWAWPRKSTHEKLTATSAYSCDGWRWQDEQKLGVTFACLAESEAEAHKYLAGARVFAHGWAKRDQGHFTDVTLGGLGNEAWRIQNDFSRGHEVTYGWRRSRLMLQVHIQCIFRTCPSDIRRAGRAWAEAIDTKAVDAFDRE